jgi:hypothetical protein
MIVSSSLFQVGACVGAQAYEQFRPLHEAQAIRIT